MNKYEIQQAKDFYMLGNYKDAYDYIKEHNINVLIDDYLAFKHIEYCTMVGYYEEALTLRDEFIEKYPKSEYINDLKNLFLDKKYNKKAKKYNKNKGDNVFEDCLDVCDCFDICFDIYTCFD